MLDDDCEKVKREKGVSALIAWIDCHPRTGWYIAALVTLNTAISLLSLFH